MKRLIDFILESDNTNFSYASADIIHIGQKGLKLLKDFEVIKKQLNKKENVLVTCDFGDFGLYKFEVLFNDNKCTYNVNFDDKKNILKNNKINKQDISTTVDDVLLTLNNTLNFVKSTVDNNMH